MVPILIASVDIVSQNGHSGGNQRVTVIFLGILIVEYFVGSNELVIDDLYRREPAIKQTITTELCRYPESSFEERDVPH
jgi:hypothetical protein